MMYISPSPIPYKVEVALSLPLIIYHLPYNMGSVVQDSELFKIPGRALSNLDLLYFAKKLNVSNFQGVFMRDEIAKISDKNKTKKSQSFILNLQSSSEPGLHWVLFYKNSNLGVIYFDSYGQPPPRELRVYVGTNVEIQRNIYTVQSDLSSECGRLCLFVLQALSRNIPYDKILQTLKRRYDGRRGDGTTGEDTEESGEE